MCQAIVVIGFSIFNYRYYKECAHTLQSFLPAGLERGGEGGWYKLVLQKRKDRCFCFLIIDCFLIDIFRTILKSSN